MPAQSNGSRPPLFLITGYMFADDTVGILSNLIAHIGQISRCAACGRAGWTVGRPVLVRRRNGR